MRKHKSQQNREWLMQRLSLDVVVTSSAMRTQRPSDIYSTGHGTHVMLQKRRERLKSSLYLRLKQLRFETCVGRFRENFIFEPPSPIY